MDSSYGFANYDYFMNICSFMQGNTEDYTIGKWLKIEGTIREGSFNTPDCLVMYYFQKRLSDWFVTYFQNITILEILGNFVLISEI